MYAAKSGVGVCPGRGGCWVDAVVVDVDDDVVAAGMALLSLEQCNIKVKGWLHILFGVACGTRC